ncbi:hypothetical protein HNQ64_001014 [Prosthecobacter dejongeii]|uniref:Uncharacterized protein n=1 Tax=Prosthecobacter dejongeii TaxID=48465 RepID=A0A7W7YJ18_9BACT|nr:hypothetical protein [Prosthecobacter dejongeii]
MLIRPNHSPQAAKAAFKVPAADWEDVASRPAPLVLTPKRRLCFQDYDLAA